MEEQGASVSQNFAITIGTLLEWMDFTFFIYLAPRLAEVFFPPVEHRFAIFSLFSAFALSHLIRPTGGFFLFGLLGDLKGRKVMMYYSLLGSGIISFLIGILPGHALIGDWAGIILFILRILQGGFASGEFGGSAIYLLESNQKSPYFYSSLSCAVASLGMLLGSILAFICYLPEVPFNFFRFPFLAGSLIAFLGVYLRNSTKETPHFLQNSGRTKAELLKVLSRFYRFKVIKTFALSAYLALYIYLCNVWWLTYVIQKGYLSQWQASFAITLGQLFTILLTLGFAKLADRYPELGKLILFFGLVVSVPSAVFIFKPLGFGLAWIFALEVMYGLTCGAISAVIFKYLGDNFPPFIRNTSQALVWNLGGAVFGGTAPLFAEKLLSYSINWVIYYLWVGALITVILNLF